MRLDFNKSELEDLISCVMLRRVEEAHPDHMGAPDFDFLMRLADLHLRLENALEVLTNGGEIKMPVSEEMKKLGVTDITMVYEPRGE